MQWNRRREASTALAVVLVFSSLINPVARADENGRALSFVHPPPNAELQEGDGLDVAFVAFIECTATLYLDGNSEPPPRTSLSSVLDLSQSIWNPTRISTSRH